MHERPTVPILAANPLSKKERLHYLRAGLCVSPILSDHLNIHLPDTSRAKLQDKVSV